MIKYYNAEWGLFDDIQCKGRHLMFICEYNQAKRCPNITPSTTFISKKWCSLQKRKPITSTNEYTTTSPFSQITKEKTTTTSTTHETTAKGPHSYLQFSLPTGKKTEAFVQSTEPGGDTDGPQSRSSSSNQFPLVIVTVALGAVLAVSVCLLVFLCCWKRRNKGNKNEKPTSETTRLPRDAIEQSSNNNQGPEDAGLTEGVQLFHQNVGESYVAYAVIHNNLTQQNQGTTASNEPAYASIEDEKMMKRSSKNDPIVAMPAATMNVENSGNSVGGKKSNTEAVYASVDKKKKNNIENEGQDVKQWPTGQQVVYASVDKPKKSKAQAENVVYAEVGSKDNTGKQQPYQITYAELADFTHDAPQEAVKPAPYQSAEYAVIIGQKQKS
ncbi:uncharacterized protein LOC116303102 [Actinia tenebrosa]|uniref:Uncharacterized protein LOC116303102 n=1 Tax=Actinia tenebrosa TaxID=6105 RepID=A0A6P8IN05_ACTTE|nr:uncharacterized protein LOC116303102 [Actinia tenebrosa]XP_031568429.1 uncharacterized protein LOC116303102 [Actinia tenebrosa]